MKKVIVLILPLIFSHLFYAASAWTPEMMLQQGKDTAKELKAKRTALAKNKDYKYIKALEEEVENLEALQHMTEIQLNKCKSRLKKLEEK